MDVRSLWDDPITKLNSCAQALDCKIGTVGELDKMAKEQPNKELTLHNLHKDVDSAAQVVKSEYQWLCRTVADALTAVSNLHLEKVKEQAGQVC